ncbi:P2Y purinoceptor 14-like protein [Labeo rohita]|uniref:P2Y purinoceptor 14-like protein n=1 Tax=Labeo rohita TaxID=84645 RepID=A0A498M5Q1_LABRO|nr:P2Y purinoceptor 14-like protein [Labeo rohita]
MVCASIVQKQGMLSRAALTGSNPPLEDGYARVKPVIRSPLQPQTSAPPPPRLIEWSPAYTVVVSFLLDTQLIVTTLKMAAARHFLAESNRVLWGVDAVERKLTDTTFQKQVAAVEAEIGGRTVDEATRMMAFFLGHPLSRKFSFVCQHENQRVQSSIMVYMKNLAAADFFLCLCLPLRIAYNATYSITIRNIYCSFGATAFYINMYASILFMDIIAANRYLKIVRQLETHALQMSSAVPVNLENLLCGQTIPKLCTLINEQETVTPAYTKGVTVQLNLRCGQTLSHSLGFFQPSPERVELGLTLEATPLVEVTSRAVYILFNNCMAMDVRLPKAYHLGWLVSYDFQDFELVLPVIGTIPVSMIPDGSSSHKVPIRLCQLTRQI